MLWATVWLPILAALALYRFCQGRGASAGSIAVGSAAIGTALLVGAGMLQGWTGSFAWGPDIVLQIGLEGLSPAFALTLPLVAALVLVYAGVHEESRGRARLLALMLGFVGAMELLVLAQDLLTLLIGWELVGALSWALIGHHGSDARKSAHARQAFLVTRFGDLGLYLAAAVAFSQTGSFSFEALAQLEGPALGLFVAGIVLAAAAKSAQLPFSPWLFSAMSGPTSASALLHSATMVSAGVYLIARLQGELSAVAWFAPLTIGLGLATALAGSVVAIFQSDAKRLLAASTSAHHGLMWVAVGAGYPSVAVAHFIAHAFLKAPLFMASGVAGDYVGSYRLTAMKLGRVMPGLAVAGLVLSLALAGLFPMGAGWTKEAIVTAAGHVAPYYAVITALLGGLSAAYCARFQLMAFGRGPEGRAEVHQLESGTIYSFAIVTVALAALWLPGSRQWLEALLDSPVPAFKAWEVLFSMLCVVLGLVLGLVLGRWSVTVAENRQEERVAASVAANWFGLPSLGRDLVSRPVNWLALSLASLDDRVVDQGLEASARLAHRLAGWNSRVGEWLFDLGPEDLARYSQNAADYAGARIEPRLFDELPLGTARVSGRLATYVRGFQSGMVHHYYTIAVIGFVTILSIFATGELF
ncbi:NADH-quinone oxidoreductase subunit L [Marinobacter salicampi]|uniref:NADH-quinone oxidoreductase subunit 5 family protein n=1 Tax=Marinobacter salicampi TaxID=435907 RepID=UPI00140CF098|nr:proton-conducting transporter membrane subunit [Marinobacter salicampi]